MQGEFDLLLQSKSIHCQSDDEEETERLEKKKNGIMNRAGELIKFPPDNRSVSQIVLFIFFPLADKVSRYILFPSSSARNNQDKKL